MMGERRCFRKNRTRERRKKVSGRGRHSSLRR